MDLDRKKFHGSSWVFLVLVIVAFLLGGGCRSTGPEQGGVRRLVRPMMGTLVQIQWRSRGDVAEFEAVRSAMDRMEALASRMNLYNPGSELARINEAAGKEPVKVSPEVFEVVAVSLDLSGRTGGAFDITVGAVEVVWGDIQKAGGGRLPSKGTVAEALGRVGYEKVRIDPLQRTVFLEEKGMRLDVGGIAKGYLVDRAMDWLHARGIRDALVDAGGDIRVSGGTEGPLWRIGLRDPFVRGRILGILRIREGAVVTSGTYERFLETDGGRFSHIMDPDTGIPASGLVSATVVAHEACLADGLATALIVKGRAAAMALLESFPSVRGVLVDKRDTIWVDDALRGVLDLRRQPRRGTVRYYRTGRPGLSDLAGSWFSGLGLAG